MTDMSSKFSSASTGSSKYLSASLNFMTADTRQGLSETAQRDLETIKTQAPAHPGVSAYVEKVESSLAKQPAVQVRSKPLRM